MFDIKCKTIKNGLNSRKGFSSKMGFTISCIGSAVGMGNIWLFPYRVGQFGGAAFLIPYIIFTILIGLTGVIGEITLGRSMQSGPLEAFSKAIESRGWNKKIGEFLSFIPIIGSLILAIGYSVVVGWIIKFVCGSITGSAIYLDEPDKYFSTFTFSMSSFIFQILALILVFIILAFGVTNGIEKFNKVLMPLFFLLFIVLALRVAFLSNSWTGYRYLFVSDWSSLFNFKTWIYALGQAFFSLSLAGNGTLVYGSYMKKDSDIPSCAKYIAAFDLIAALLSSLVIIPAVFAFSLDPNHGPPLMFITMPQIFKNMWGGQVFMIVFFIAVLFAALTSLINLFETPIETLQTHFRFKRTSAVMLIALLSMIIGFFVRGFLSQCMDICTVYICPLGALLAAIMFFWVCDKDFIRTNVDMGAKHKIGNWFEPMGKYIFCGITIFVFIIGVFYGNIG